MYALDVVSFMDSYLSSSRPSTCEKKGGHLNPGVYIFKAQNPKGRENPLSFNIYVPSLRCC